MASFKNNLSLYLGVLRRVGHTLTLGMITQSGREKLPVLYQLYSHRAAEEDLTPEDPYILPKTDILELIGNDPATYDGVNECGFGHTTEFELKVICNLVKHYAPKTIFEIGTF